MSIVSCSCLLQTKKLKYWYQNALKTPVTLKCKFHILTKTREELHCEAMSDDEVTVVRLGVLLQEENQEHLAAFSCVPAMILRDSPLLCLGIILGDF